MVKRRCRKCRIKFDKSELSEAKLCRNCAPDIGRSAKELSDKLNAENIALEKLQALEDRLKRCFKIMGYASKLAEYEKYGKPLMDPPAATVVEKFEEMKLELVEREIELALKDGTRGVSGALNRKEKEDTHATMRSKLIKIGELSEQYEVELSDKRKSIIDQARLREIIFKGNNAQFDGDINKAFEFYREGLAEMTKDGVSKAVQVEGIKLLTKNIEELQKQK